MYFGVLFRAHPAPEHLPLLIFTTVRVAYFTAIYNTSQSRILYKAGALHLQVYLLTWSILVILVSSYMLKAPADIYAQTHK
uniref:Uncharacterized protein n=1 Tax=Physcomitrium patens TaxID=3218 RepID=A0A2K1JW76_PHYPA|nr:hypothetical protein PHYPA_015549 [Physcomitrium patens]